MSSAGSSGRRLIVTVTHFHPEHGYAAQVFHRDATIFYNRTQRDEQIAKGERYIGLFRDTQGTAAATALDGTRIVMPDAVYDGPSTEIDLGGRKVQFHTFGTAHTRGDQVVFLPKERIRSRATTSKSACSRSSPGSRPTNVEVDGRRWVEILTGFKQFVPILVALGHGDPGTIAIASNIALQIETVGSKVRALAASGKASPRSSATTSQLRRRHPDLGASRPARLADRLCRGPAVLMRRPSAGDAIMTSRRGLAAAQSAR